ncbi:MAG: hypothetical protein JNL75_10975 [Chitinophagales bacterium]|nr:hypothetical protein [Chitinophagales bacterium]
MLLSSISCSDGYSFGLELYNKRLRFIIYLNKEELACRKEEAKVLTSFFQSTNQGIFQGRIKLNSVENHIIVFFKGQCVGTIAKKELENISRSILHS